MPTATNTNGRTNANGRTTISPEPRLGQHGRETQPFDTLRNLPIGLPAKARLESCRLLNEIQADSMVLTALYKKHHWLVAGPTFYQLHLLFDKHAAEQLEIVDLVAERVQSLGGIAVGDIGPVPEPSALALISLGGAGLVAMLRRRQHKAQAAALG